METYRRNHYVPKWFQKRFLTQDMLEQKFYYLDLKPACILSGNRKHHRKETLRWGPSNCFYEKDLYTTSLGNWNSTEIEQKFFGKVDSLGSYGVDYFSSFQHPSVDGKAFYSLLPYMSIQKMRTPKGLAYLSKLVQLEDKNLVLFKMQELQQLFCALWTECVWSIADASDSETKFILSDHPVTVYNKGCFPGSRYCQGFNDPEIWQSGTHTLFPLDLNKVLILTNLSWVRDPHSNPLKLRPNPIPFRAAMFNFMEIQTQRKLSEVEVNEINFIIKNRAYRYIAAKKEEWLYPERMIPTQMWDKLGRGYLLMPDPRSVVFSRDTTIGYKDKTADRFDEYGRKPWQRGYDDKNQSEKEWETFLAFQGEFARMFGPKRRGRSFDAATLDNEEDSPDYHAYHLALEARYRNRHGKK